MTTETVADSNVFNSELSDLLRDVRFLKEKFLAVEKDLDTLRYKASATMDELSRAEQALVALVEERHTLALRCLGWVLRHRTSETFTELDDMFTLQERLVGEIAAVHEAILKRNVYSKMGYPS